MFQRFNRLSRHYKWFGIRRSMSAAGQEGKKPDTLWSKAVAFYTKHRQLVDTFFIAATCVQMYASKVLWNRIAKVQALTDSQAVEILLWKEIQSMEIDVFQTDKLDSGYDAKVTKLERALEAAAEVGKLNEFLVEQLVQEGIVTVKKKEESP